MARTALGTTALIGLGIVVLGAGAVARLYQRDIQTARDLVSSGSRVADTPCGPIEYAVIGEGSPVLMVHGAGGGFDQGRFIAHELADRGLRVILPSRFGYLRTPLPADASPAAQADAHACLLDALAVERVAVIGASAGSPSSLQFALRHPQRISALILVVPLAYAPKPASTVPSATAIDTAFLLETVLRSDFLLWAAIEVAPKVLIRAILATPPEVVDQATPEEQARVMQMLHQILPVSQRQQGLLNDAKVATSLPRYDLERVETPTLIISCKDDLFQIYDGARYTAEHIPGARFIGYDRGGHVWVGHHEEMLSNIAAALSK